MKVLPSESNSKDCCNPKKQKITRQLTRLGLPSGAAAVGATVLWALFAPCHPSLTTLGIPAGILWTTSHESDAATLEKLEREVNLPRLHKVPSSFTDLPDDQERLKKLLAERPDFQKIINWKRASDSDAKEIKVDFIQGPNGEEFGVVCKDGKLCPCSDPLVYKTSNSLD